MQDLPVCYLQQEGKVIVSIRMSTFSTRCLIASMLGSKTTRLMSLQGQFVNQFTTQLFVHVCNVIEI